jgi:cytochrome c biogenesis protein CcmG/thiol:disulfide interchange protein DsbE
MARANDDVAAAGGQSRRATLTFAHASGQVGARLCRPHRESGDVRSRRLAQGGLDQGLVGLVLGDAIERGAQILAGACARRDAHVLPLAGIAAGRERERGRDAPLRRLVALGEELREIVAREPDAPVVARVVGRDAAERLLPAREVATLPIEPRQLRGGGGRSAEAAHDLLDPREQGGLLHAPAPEHHDLTGAAVAPYAELDARDREVDVLDVFHRDEALVVAARHLDAVDTDAHDRLHRGAGRRTDERPRGRRERAPREQPLELLGDAEADEGDAQQEQRREQAHLAPGLVRVAGRPDAQRVLVGGEPDRREELVTTLQPVDLDHAQIAGTEADHDAVAAGAEWLDPPVRDVRRRRAQRPLARDDQDLRAVDVERPRKEDARARLGARIRDALVVREEGQAEVREGREEASHDDHPAPERARHRDEGVDGGDRDRHAAQLRDSADTDAGAPVDRRLAHGAEEDSAERVARRPPRCFVAPVRLVTLLVVVLSAGLAVAGCAGDPKKPRAHALHPMIGEQVPELHQAAIDGGTVDLPVPGAKVTIIDFFASWCEPCAASLPAIDAFATEHEGEGVRLVLVSLDDDPNAAGAFLDRVGVKRPATIDPKLAIAKRFKVEKLPMTFVVAADGKIVWQGKQVEGAHDAVLDQLGLPAEHGSPAPPRPSDRPVRLQPSLH